MLRMPEDRVVDASHSCTGSWFRDDILPYYTPSIACHASGLFGLSFLNDFGEDMTPAHSPDDLDVGEH